LFVWQWMFASYGPERRRLLNHLVLRGGLADDVKVGLGAQHRHQAIVHDGVVVGDRM
jgi:hypothetical protein